MTSLNRRSLVKGAAWTVPAVVVAPAAPVLAASRPAQGLPTGNTFLSIAAKDVNNPDIVDPVYHKADTLASVDLKPVYAMDEKATPTVNWNESGCQTAQTFARGVGVFTPYGTLNAVAPGEGSGFVRTAVGGTGLWIGSPVDASGLGASGKTVLSAGTTIVVTVRARMNNEQAMQVWNGEVAGKRTNGARSYLWGPRINRDNTWGPFSPEGNYIGNDKNYGRTPSGGRTSRLPGNAPMTWGRMGSVEVRQRLASTSKWRVAESGVPMSCVMEWDRDRTAELTLKGTATFSLRQDLVVEGEGRRQRYNQVMLPTNSIWEAPLNSEVVEMTWSLDVVSGTLTSNGVRQNAAEVFPHREITIRHASNPANAGVCRA